MQTGIEYIGSCDAAVLAEIILLAEKSLSSISPNYALDISHMGLVSQLLQTCRVPEGEFPQVLDMIRRKDRHGMQAYAKGRGLTVREETILDLLIILSGPIRPGLVRLMDCDLPSGTRKVIRELEAILDIADSVWQGHLNLDFSGLSDMRYYNGLTLSGFIDGVPAPILSGGQYDPLLKKLGRSGQGIGFAVYLNEIERSILKTAEAEPTRVHALNDPKEAFIRAEQLRQNGPVVLMPGEKAGEDLC